MHKRYGRIASVCKQINYDIKQGATNDQVLLFLQKIREDSFFLALISQNGLEESEKGIRDIFRKSRQASLCMILLLR